MASSDQVSAPDFVERRRIARIERLKAIGRDVALAAAVAAVVVWAHFWSGLPVFSSHGSIEPGWAEFNRKYDGENFGADGYFTRAVQNGYNIIYNTPKHAPRFTRRTAADRPNSCGDCHTPEALAIAFASSDRFDRTLKRRISFEERVMRCYVKHLDGFVPTIYDPAVRDIRIFARLVAHRMQLGEGSLDAGR
jgi:hypothetical protein